MTKKQLRAGQQRLVSLVERAHAKGKTYRGHKRKQTTSVRAQTAIITQNVNPPIPLTSHDWCAYWEGTEESRQYGWGRTHDEAVADLKANYPAP